LVADAGLAPENFSGALRRFQADVVLLVDAAEMDRPPGSIAWLDWRDTRGFGPSTHLQPLATLAEYLEKDLGCTVGLLGIQPANLDFDQPLSPRVEKATLRLALELARRASGSM
jgi:hydrogenase maturation protease